MRGYAGQLLLGRTGSWATMLIARDQRQVIAHDINRQGRKYKNHSNPEAPIAMRAFPVRTVTMMNGIAVMSVLHLIHWFPVSQGVVAAAIIIHSSTCSLTVSGRAVAKSCAVLLRNDSTASYLEWHEPR